MNNIFIEVLNMSISASWLMIVVFIIRKILKKYPKWITLALWLIVAIRLLIPVTYESSVSLIPNTEPILENIIEENYTLNDSVIETENNIVNNNLISDRTEGINIVEFLSIIWGFGIIVSLGYMLINYFKVYKKLSTAVIMKNNIFQSENIDFPFVFGFLNPKIYIPYGMSDSNIKNIVIHEEAHVKHFDHLYKIFGFVILSIHWFNPLVWCSYILLCKDLELACDERVIKKLDSQERALYSEALLSCSVNTPMFTFYSLSFGEIAVKERIKNMLNYKKTSVFVTVVAIIVCVIVSICFLTNHKEAKKFKEDNLEYDHGKSSVTVTAYIKEINPSFVSFDQVEIVDVPSERSEELGIKPTGQVLEFYNEEVRIVEFPVSEFVFSQAFNYNNQLDTLYFDEIDEFIDYLEEYQEYWQTGINYEEGEHVLDFLIFDIVISNDEVISIEEHYVN